MLAPRGHSEVILVTDPRACVRVQLTSVCLHTSPLTKRSTCNGTTVPHKQTFFSRFLHSGGTRVSLAETFLNILKRKFATSRFHYHRSWRKSPSIRTALRPVTVETRCFHKKLELQRYPPKDFYTARYEHKSWTKKFQTFQKPEKNNSWADLGPRSA